MKGILTNLSAITDEFDVIIAGGGPAGSAAAIAALRAGCTVLVVDRGIHPRQKVCGCCLAPAGIKVLAQLGASSVLDSAQKLSVVRLECGGQVMQMRREGGVAIARDELDESLLDFVVEQGGIVLMGSVASFDLDGSVVVRQDKIVRTIRSRVRIAADGLQGTSLDGISKFEWRVSKSSRMGFGATVDGAALDISREQILMSVHNGGYIGAVRLTNGRIDIAAAAHPSVIRGAGGVAPLAAQWLGSHVSTTTKFVGEQWRGTPFLTRRRMQLAYEDVLVAGDASGYVEPFTGEGMSWALATGSAAGNHASAMILASASSKEWPIIANRIVRSSRMRCLMTAHLLRHARLLRTGIRAAHFFPSLADRVASAFGSNIDTPAPSRIFTKLAP
ncbi:MAG: FAD-dependent oxidoreductase [Planctomycetota bacterium]|nr:MAG: FAD-dependent oxidoreductase [Planctomycetota bacterium]